MQWTGLLVRLLLVSVLCNMNVDTYADYMTLSRKGHCGQATATHNVVHRRFVCLSARHRDRDDFFGAAMPVSGVQAVKLSK